MRSKFSLFEYQFYLLASLMAVVLPAVAGAPFGFADSAFNCPRFTSRCYPEYCFADGHGGLLWSLVNTIPEDFVGANGLRVGGLVRTTADGILDTNFVASPNLRETLGIAFQPDGKILVGGRWIGDLAPNGAPNYRVFRLLTNGVADVSYQSPVFGFAPRFMTVQPDGKLLVGTTLLSGTPAPNGGIVNFARLNTDGSLDAGFNQPMLTVGIFALFAPPVVDTNNAIYIAGGFSYVNGQSRPGVARLLADGTLDPAFIPSGFTAIGPNRGLELQPDGKVIIGGRLRVGGTYYVMVRMNNDGTFDPSFNLVSASSLNFTRIRRMLSTPDGKLLAVDASMARFNSDGSLDNSFTRLPFGTDDPSFTAATCYWFDQLADGRVVVPSDPNLADTTTINGQPFNGAVRLLTDGTLNPTFSQPVFQQDIFPTIARFETDGRLLVAGGFDHIGANLKALLGRLNTDGTPDPGYNLGVPAALSVLGLAPAPVNQSYALVQAGNYFVSYSNVLVRLNSDGAVDPGFNLDEGSINTNGYLFTDLFLQGTQPVLLASPSPQALVNNTNFPMLRFQSNGALDPTYHCDLPVTGIVYAADGTLLTNLAGVAWYSIGEFIMNDLQPLALFPDGGLLAALGTTNAGSPYVYQTLRLNPNGSVDHSFNSLVLSPADSFITSANIYDGLGNYGSVQCIYPKRCLTSALVQSNGMLLVVGTFTNLGGSGGSMRPGIVRLFPNGWFDTNFPAGIGPVTAQGTPVKISGLAADGAGKVWVTGNFVRWDGFNAPGYVRLNADGTVDTNCVPQSTHYAVDDYNVDVFSGALPRGTNECFVFGPHLLPGDVWPRALTHLVPYLPPPLYPVGLLPGIGFEMTFRSESGQSYWLQSSADLKTWQNLSGFQGTGGQMTLTDPGALLLSRHFYRVVYQ